MQHGEPVKGGTEERGIMENAKTPNDFARAAQQIGQLAVEMKPDDTDPYAQQRKLVQYHLLMAASKTREIAEALARKEPSAK
jgi:hypothetical protein